MTLDEIITFFEDVEKGNEDQKINYALHFGITQAVRLNWFNRFTESNSKFSDFLKALKNSDYEPTTR